MIDFSKLFDNYSRKARLFPGLLTLFPIIVTAIAWFPRLITSSWGATLVTLGTSCGLLFGLSVLTRSRGRAVEKRLLKEWGGWPTTLWLRHRDSSLPTAVKTRYHAFFAQYVPHISMPSADDERRDPALADDAYASCVKWLQEHCRGKDFSMVEKENAEYGFRRNLRGMKGIGIAACVFALVISLLAIIWRYEALGYAISSSSLHALLVAFATIKPAAIGTIAIDLVALVGWMTIVNDGWVRDAGDQFARALLANCDTLIPGAAAPPAKRKSKSSAQLRSEN